MAAADYRLCDKCGEKAFYDATLNYDQGLHPENELVRDSSYKLDNLGDWAVLCRKCARTHRAVIMSNDDLGLTDGVKASGFWCDKVPHGEQRCPKQCALCAEADGVLAPVVTDGMALVFHRATTDGDIGGEGVETIKAGLRAVFDALGVEGKTP